MRPTDQEIIAVGKIVCYSWFPRGNHGGLHMTALGVVRKQRD